jgi:hypothetical protein
MYKNEYELLNWSMNKTSDILYDRLIDQFE